MDTRIALIGIVVNHSESVDKLNHLLSEYGQYIIGRMGLPYREKGISIISIAGPTRQMTSSAHFPVNLECFPVSVPKQFTQRHLQHKGRSVL